MNKEILQKAQKDINRKQFLMNEVEANSRAVENYRLYIKNLKSNSGWFKIFNKLHRRDVHGKACYRYDNVVQQYRMSDELKEALVLEYSKEILRLGILNGEMLKELSPDE